MQLLECGWVLITRPHTPYVCTFFLSTSRPMRVSIPTFIDTLLDILLFHKIIRQIDWDPPHLPARFMLSYACALSDTLKLPCCPEWPLLAWENGSITMPFQDVCILLISTLFLSFLVFISRRRVYHYLQFYQGMQHIQSLGKFSLVSHCVGLLVVLGSRFRPSAATQSFLLRIYTRVFRSAHGQKQAILVNRPIQHFLLVGSTQIA